MHLTLCLLRSTAGNFGKQFGYRSGPMLHRTCSVFKLFVFLMVFLKEFFEYFNFKKIADDDKKHAK